MTKLLAEYIHTPPDRQGFGPVVKKTVHNYSQPFSKAVVYVEGV